MTIINTIAPKPGSKEAIAEGCTCPVIDNHYGKGHHGVEGEFVYSLACPIHIMSTETLQEIIGIK